MQNEMELGGKMFFDLFVAMVNHMVSSQFNLFSFPSCCCASDCLLGGWLILVGWFL